MNPQLKKLIGKNLYLIAAGMILGQIFFYVATQTYVLIPTLVALILIVFGNIIRR